MTSAPCFPRIASCSPPHNPETASRDQSAKSDFLSTNGGEWTEIREVEFPFTIEDPRLTPGAVVEVRVQLENRHGAGPWSVNTPNQAGGSGGAELPQATLRLN